MALFEGNLVFSKSSSFNFFFFFIFLILNQSILFKNSLKQRLLPQCDIFYSRKPDAK